MRSSYGFTLIELIVVIVIISILATFAVLSINRSDPDSATACRSDMQSWLAAQAVMAQSTGRVVYIRSDGQAPTAFLLHATVPSPARSAASANQSTTQATTQAVNQAVNQATANPPTTAPRLRATALSTLSWPVGCALRAQPSPQATLAADDPRQQAVLAVTPGGQWSLPPGSVTGAATPAAPTTGTGLRLKIARRANSQAELDLAAPLDTPPTTPAP